MKRSVENMVIAAGIFLSGVSFAESSYRLNCWDGSFAYNTVNVLKTTEGFEVSLTGSTLLQSEEDFNWNPVTVHALFPTESCVVDGGEIDCHLHQSAGLVLERYRPAPEEEPYEYYSVDSLKFSSGEGIALKVQGHVAPISRSDSFSLGFDPYTCNNQGSTRSGGTHWGAATFNESVRDLFRQRTSS